jgi:trimeric autotransporter adhesin
MKRHLLVSTFAAILFSCEGAVVAPTTPSPGQNPNQPTGPATPPSNNTPPQPGGPPSQPGEMPPPVTEPGGPSIDTLKCSKNSTEVGKTLTCDLKGSHPDTLALSCQLSVSDGRAPIEVGDCSSLKQVMLTFSEPGVFTLSLVVTDTNQRKASQTLTVEATAPAVKNAPPTVDSFVAMPNSGGVPFSTMLKFSVSDPDNDKLSCSIDLSSGAGVEYPNIDCAAKAQAVTLSSVGVVDAVLKVTDAAGASAESKVTLEAKNASGDIRVQTIEFGQVTLLEKLRLVEGKATLLRVVGLASQAGLTASAEVEAKMGQTSLGIQKMQAPKTVPQTEDKLSLEKSFNLALPLEWVKPGVSLTVRLDPDNVLAEADEMNNVKTVELDVGRGNVLHLTRFPLVSSGQRGNAALLDLPKLLMQHWPLADVEEKTRAPLTLQTPINGNSQTWGAALEQIESARRADGSSRNYFGVAPDPGNRIGGVAYAPGFAALASEGQAIASIHEIGHNLSLMHAPCGGPAGIDPNYPDPRGALLTRGYDGQNIVNPAGFTDIMGYCPPKNWVSAYNYKLTQTYLESRREFAPGNLQLQAPSTLEDSLLLSGSITDDGVSFLPVHRMRSTPDRLETSDLTLTLSTDSGRTFSVPVQTVAVPELHRQHFAVVVPFVENLHSIELFHGKRSLGRREAQALHQPVTATAERVDAQHVVVRWTGGESASIADIVNERERVSMSLNNFEDTQRVTLAVDARGGEATVQIDGLAPTTLEVSVSDGVRSAVVRVPVKNAEAW